MALFPKIFLIAFAVSAGQAGTAIAASPAEEPAPQQESSAGLFETYFNQLGSGKYAEALGTASGIQPGDDKSRLGIVAAMRGGAMIGLKRDDEAAALFARARALAPEVELVHNLEFTAAVASGRMDVAANALDTMIARTPDFVRNLHQPLIWAFLRGQPKGQVVRNEGRRVALARLGYGGNDGDQIAFEAIGILLKRGDAAGAVELLQYIDEPRIVEDMLIQKRYAALWPRIELNAGPGLATVRAAGVRAADLAYQEAPEDSAKLQRLATALRYARKFDEAIALQAKLPATPAAIAASDEEMGWAINNIALSLYEAQRADEADKLFASLNEATMLNGGWRVSMKINRLELVVAAGKFQQALPLLDPTEASARTDGNPYAQQLVRRLKYCTVSGLGRKDEAAKLLPDVLKHAEDAPAPTIDGLLCAGEIDNAERVALASLKVADFEGDFVRSLQARPLTADDPSVWSKGWVKLRQRPAIRQAFDRLGRDMPTAYLPPKSPG